MGRNCGEKGYPGDITLDDADAAPRVLASVLICKRKEKAA
jgi:hypothetical protein